MRWISTRGFGFAQRAARYRVTSRLTWRPESDYDITDQNYPRYEMTDDRIGFTPQQVADAPNREPLVPQTSTAEQGCRPEGRFDLNRGPRSAKLGGFGSILAPPDLLPKMTVTLPRQPEPARSMHRRTRAAVLRAW